MAFEIKSAMMLAALALFSMHAPAPASNDAENDIVNLRGDCPTSCNATACPEGEHRNEEGGELDGWEGEPHGCAASPPGPDPLDQCIKGHNCRPEAPDVPEPAIDLPSEAAILAQSEFGAGERWTIIFNADRNMIQLLDCRGLVLSQQDLSVKPSRTLGSSR